MKLSLWAYHFTITDRLVVSLSSTKLLSGLAPSALFMLCPPQVSAGDTRSANNPFLVKLPKSRITAHLYSFVSLFSACGINFHILFNLILPSRSSRPKFTTI